MNKFFEALRTENLPKTQLYTTYYVEITSVAISTLIFI
jgi:hypothetical protein